MWTLLVLSGYAEAEAAVAVAPSDDRALASWPELEIHPLGDPKGDMTEADGGDKAPMAAGLAKAGGGEVTDRRTLPSFMTVVVAVVVLVGGGGVRLLLRRPWPVAAPAPSSSSSSSSSSSRSTLVR